MKMIDEAGNRYGKLVVLKCAGKAPRGSYLWHCQCDCGGKKIVLGIDLRSGNIKSCGCAHAKDETGKRYGKLIVIKRADNYKSRISKKRIARWLCQCDCGNTKIVYGSSLRNGHTKSCGCLNHANKLPESQAAFNALFRSRKYSAKTRNHEFDLSQKQFEELIKQPCFYCGALPGNIASYATYNGDYIYNGLDRFDNNKGYVIGNVVPCCAICNKAKFKGNISTFLNWLKQIAIHNKWKCDIDTIKFTNIKEV